MIRQLIREILLQETSLADVVPPRHRPKGVDWDYSAGGGIEYGDDITTKYRRDVKRDWNKYADHNFFQDPEKLQVIHYLGLYSKNNSLADYFPSGNLVPGKIPGIHIPNRIELSCIGLVPPINNPEDHYPDFHLDKKRFFTFKQYRVTLVSNIDAGTERLSRATPEDIDKMKGSGLAKRPATNTDEKHLPVDKESMISSGRGFNKYDPGEVVIDNWIVDTFYCDDKMVEQAKALGLKYKVVRS